MLCALAARRNYAVHLVDIQNAFVSSDLDRDLYMALPPGDPHEGTGKICKLKKSLYGLRQSPRLWSEHMHKYLRQLGFEPLQCDSCVYRLRQNGKECFVSVYVDDCLIVGHDALVTSFKTQLSRDYKVRDYDTPSSYLGMDFSMDRARGTVSLAQTTYIDSMLARFGLWLWAVRTGALPNPQNRMG